MNKQPGDLQSKIDALCRSYVGQLPEKLAHLETSWRDVRGGVPGAAAEMRRQAHSLVGSGATFGLAEVSRTARDLEKLLEPLLTEPGASLGERQAGIASALEALRSATRNPGAGAEYRKPGRHKALPPATPSLQQNRLIYLVEDDETLARELSMQLEHFGYTVQHFQDPEKLCLAVDEATPGAILMDIVFPQGDLAGTDAVRAVQHGREKSVPVVFISSRSDFPARLAAVQAGGEAYFVKPIEISALIDKLDQLTSRQPREPYRVLIVDDSPTSAGFYALTLEQEGMVTQTVTDPMQVMDALAEFSPELILMDMYMPACAGDEVARVIRQQAVYVGIPIVFLSAETDVGKQLAAMSQGGDDFLAKPIRPEYLASSVTTRVERYRTLRNFMIRDSLTGLLNHTKLKEQLDSELARAIRHNRPLAFAMVDIDHFKSVNDTYGHPTGDRVIKSIARLLRQRLRQEDIVGRYGGEEFAIIMPDTDGPTAVRVLDSIREAFARIRQHNGETDFSVTFSCGVASYPGFASANELCNAADRTLYRAKHEGRNRVLATE